MTSQQRDLFRESRTSSSQEARRRVAWSDHTLEEAIAQDLELPEWRGRGEGEDCEVEAEPPVGERWWLLGQGSWSAACRRGHSESEGGVLSHDVRSERAKEGHSNRGLV